MSTTDGWPEEPVASLDRTPITIHFTGFVMIAVVSLAPIPRGPNEGDGLRKERQISLKWSSPTAYSAHNVAEKVVMILDAEPKTGWSPGVKALYDLAQAELARVAEEQARTAAMWAAQVEEAPRIGIPDFEALGLASGAEE